MVKIIISRLKEKKILKSVYMQVTSRGTEDKKEKYEQGLAA